MMHITTSLEATVKQTVGKGNVVKLISQKGRIAAAHG